DALNKIDAEITRLEGQIRSLRQLRNNFIPISRFPPEILSKVFLHCHNQDQKSPTSRLTLSWVSRHWRNVALEYPALWTS
ncbi:hypothetical protein BDN72DRAFT_736969, partial [Pluteus cervinus]